MDDVSTLPPQPTTGLVAAAALIVAGILASVVWVLVMNSHPPTTYSDFIVGSVSWQADSKWPDLVVMPLALGVFLAVNAALRRLGAALPTADADRLAGLLLVWSIPAVTTFGNLLGGGNLDRHSLALSTLGCGYVALTSAYQCYRRHPPDLDWVAATSLIVLLWTFIPVALAVVWERLSGQPTAPAVVPLMKLLVLAGLLFYGLRLPPVSTTLLDRGLLLGQLSLPALWLLLYPAKLLPPDGQLTSYATTPWLGLLLALAIIVSLGDVLWRYRQPVQHWRRRLSPLALFALLIALRSGQTVAPYIGADDYHFGEQLLGGWLYRLGAIPYVDYLPAHGLIDDDLASLLSALFFDGSAGSLIEAGRVSFALLALVAYLALYRLGGSLVWAWLATLWLGNGMAIGSGLSWLFLTPFICLWLSPWLRATPLRWLAIWSLSLPLLILGSPAKGLILTMAALPLAAAMLRDGWRRLPGHGRPLLLAALLLFGLGLVTPLPAMLYGAIRYVLENGPINQLAHGIAWQHSWQNQPRGLWFEAIRMSWIVVPTLGLWLLARQRAGAIPRQPALLLVLFVLLLTPYVMGRIDPGALSRPGIAAVFGWAVLLPLLLWQPLSRARQMALLLGCALGSATLNLTPPYLSQLLAAIPGTIGTGPLRDGRQHGLANIGRAAVEEQHWQRLLRLAATLDQQLLPRQAYLDLTSRNAQYFYLDRPPLLPVTAPYNLVGRAQQQRALALLQQHPPKIALIEGHNLTHDGGGLALRSPLLYRYLLANYTATLENGFIIGYRNAAPPRATGAAFIGPLRNLSDQHWERGVHRSETAVIVGDATLLALLSVGSTIKLGDDQLRTVQKIWLEGSAIWLDGPPLNPNQVGYPELLTIVACPEQQHELSQRLLDHALAATDLQKIAVAWGRSAHRLQPRMRPVHRFSATQPALTADHPRITLDLPAPGLNGRNAGLLQFHLMCHGPQTEPRLRVAWQNDADPVSPAAQLTFTAADGPLIIPLDAVPRWLNQTGINQISITLLNPGACSAINIKEIGLFQRHEL